MLANTAFAFANVDDVWPRIAARAARSCTDAERIRAVRYRCHEGGDAVCLESPDGALIVAAEAAPDGSLTAMVLLAVSNGLHGAFKRQEGAMLSIARDLGASRIAFRTDRRGWMRLLGPQWHASGDGYARPV